MDKQSWKEAIRKSQWVKGKKLTKKERNDIMEAMILLKPKQSKENWKVKQEPKSIKDILNL